MGIIDKYCQGSGAKVNKETTKYITKYMKLHKEIGISKNKKVT